MARKQVLRGSTMDVVETTFERRPTTCTVTVYGSDGAVLVPEAPAVLGALTTITADCGMGSDNRRLVTVSSVTGLEFRRGYVVANADGQFETATLLSLPTDGACETAEPLAYPYVKDDTLEDPRAWVVCDATITATAGVNLRARFSAVYSVTEGEGEEEVTTVLNTIAGDVIFDVVEHVLSQPITSANIHRYSPKLLDLLTAGTRGTAWHSALETSWDAVYQDLVTAGVVPSQYMDADRLAQLHLLRLRAMLAQDGITPTREEWPLQTYEKITRAYMAELQAACGKAAWVDRNSNLIPGEPEETTPTQQGRYV